MRRKLPREFTEGLYASFPQEVAERILRGMGARRRTTLRANALRWDAAGLARYLREHAVKHRPVPWYAEAVILEDLGEREVAAWDVYQDGRIYVQGISSMIPALLLAPRPGERVLDIAAAPGSKTTQLASLMGNRGFILANEPDPVRAQRLAHNIRLQGCAIAEVRVGRGESIGGTMPAGFDKALVDAPCSGEGRFLVQEPATWRAWSPRAVSDAARLQKRLIASAAAALRPGGTLVYSTCTMNLAENEAIVQWAVDTLSLRPQRLPVTIPGSCAAPLNGIRILPDRDREGFFACRLSKE